jgi:hypothetical protein
MYHYVNYSTGLLFYKMALELGRMQKWESACPDACPVWNVPRLFFFFDFDIFFLLYLIEIDVGGSYDECVSSRKARPCKCGLPLIPRVI